MKKGQLFFFLSMAMLSSQTQSNETPNIDALLLYKPTFSTNFGETREAGAAFVVSFDGRRYVVTAHHLFGPSGGFSKEMTPAQIAANITKVELRNVISGETTQAGENIKIDGAKTTSWKNSADKDIAVFKTDLAAGGLTLSAQAPKQGDSVWLLARSRSAEDTAIAHAAVIAYVSNGSVFYKFENTSIDLHATSGAPVVDRNGNVVAINTASIPIPFLPKIGVGGTVTYLQEQIYLIER